MHCSPFSFKNYNVQPVIPSLYWESITPEQQILELFKNLNGLKEYSNTQTEWIENNAELITKLDDEFEEFKESGFVYYYAEQINNWINEHLPELFADFLKNQIYFGLNDAGYFVAYIPDSWNEIQFDTGAVFNNYDYGRLILRYGVEGAVNNTQYTTIAQYDVISAQIDNLIQRVQALESEV